MGGLNLTGRSARAILLSVLAVALVQSLPHTLAVAQPEDRAISREAATHFQRGVTLYGETDYRGALVEFNRAYALSPSRVVLYNLGQTEYQLRDYAGALAMFERYLAEAGPSDAHRAELEHSVSELKARVGRLTVTTVPAGAEVSIDDRVVGKTPFPGPLVVSMGRLKVSASAPGRPPVTRYVDVAAEDSVSVSLELPASGLDAARLDPRSRSALADASVPSAGAGARSDPGGVPWRTVGWISTGVLASGAVVFGVVALRESSDLDAERNRFPPRTTALDRKSNLTTTFSVLADSFAVAAIIVGGLTLYSTLGSGGEAHATAVTVGLGSVDVRVTF